MPAHVAPVNPVAVSTAADHERRILGVRFFIGPLDELLERTLQGGLIVVPSAPVLVAMPANPAHREAVEGSDLAVTDSGLLILLWRLFRREPLERISGLRYLRALLATPEFRRPGATFWVMPSADDAKANRAWLNAQGMSVTEADCYVAPHYARHGPLQDPALAGMLSERRPRFVVLNLGGGVQERLGFYLREELARKAQSGKSEADAFGCEVQSGKSTAVGPFPLGSLPLAPAYKPTLICTGAAIAFLSNRQVNIPPWADRLFLGWLFRCLSEPAKFIPRYWKSLRLVTLLWKHGSKSVTANP